MTALIGLLFGLIWGILGSGGGHGMVCEAVLAGSPLSVFNPEYLVFLGSLFFWTSLGFFWKRIRICRYLVAIHLLAAGLAFGLVPEYRDWYRLRNAPETYKYTLLVSLVIHFSVLFAAVTRNEKGRRLNSTTHPDFVKNGDSE